MRWLADENIHSEIVRELRGAGHDAIYAAEVSPQASDRALLEWARGEQRILLTEDKDFGEIVFYESRPSAGVVLLRVRSQSWVFKWTRLLSTITVRGEALLGHFTVIEPDGLRIQPLIEG